MQSLKLFNSLCKPAQLYLGMSILAVLVQCYQMLEIQMFLLAD